MIVNSNHHKLRQAGFTLIELMVVVTIIGIMMAVGVPYFISYRDQAHLVASLASGARGALAAAAADHIDSLYPDDSEIQKASDLNRYGTSFQNKIYQSFKYQSLNQRKSYQIDIITINGKELCVKPAGIERKKC